MATLTTLVAFAGYDGGNLAGGLLVDANGDLFGTATDKGANNDGTVFEVPKTASGYASTPVTLFAFSGTDGEGPESALIADANGDLFGTTYLGGAYGYGTVFEVPKTAAGYATAPTTLVSLTATEGVYPFAGLAADASGDLFGVTVEGGVNGYGTLFEVAKTPGGYASTPTVLVTFTAADEVNSGSGLITDANGDLFGAGEIGGSAGGDGSVFEIVKTAAGYASTPTLLASFDGADGFEPNGSLLADANGDLFGLTSGGGANNDGTVFEIAKTPGGYASTPITLVSFDEASDMPIGSLIADANGDLFGTTQFGGASSDGTVFEIAKTATGYASVPTVLATFNDNNGLFPESGVIADANGDLFGTTDAGGDGGYGTVFELTNTGYVTAPPVSVTGHGQSVTLGSGATSVSVTGYHESVTGTGMGPVTAALTGLSNTVNLGDGNDTVTTNGRADGSTIVLGNGNDSVTLGTNNNAATLGGGSNTIALGGFNNTVVAGDGNNIVTGGTGHAHVTLGNGINAALLGGWVNSITLGDGTNAVDAGAGSSTVEVSGGQLALEVHGHGDMVFLHGNTLAEINNQSTGLSLTIDSDAVSVALYNPFGADMVGVVHLQGLGFTTVQQVLGDLHSDNFGGTMLDFGATGFVDFANTAPSALTAANFALS